MGRFGRLIARVGFTVALAGSIGSGQQSGTSLQITIASDQDVYNEGEDVTITLTIRNTGSTEVRYGLAPFYEQLDDAGHGRVFFQNIGDVVVTGRVTGTLEGSSILRRPPVGARQKVVVLRPDEAYRQSLMLSRYFELRADLYEIYAEHVHHEDEWRPGPWWDSVNGWRSNVIVVEVVRHEDNGRES